MRNLEILTKQIDTLNALHESETITHAGIDEHAKLLIVYTSQHRLILCSYDCKVNGTCCITDETPAVDGAVLVLMTYVQELQGVQLVYNNGVMLIYKVESSTIEELGEIPQGCLAAAWSPNQEYLAVATSKMMIIFTPEFDILHEHMLDDSEGTFTVEELMSDRKECQITEAVISWRGDSQIFVCTYLIKGGRKCLTRDMTKNGQVTKGPAKADNQVVFSVSEKPLPQLELPTCIMPNGSLVTGFQNRVLPNGKIQPEIIFWERNGLRHGEFTLQAFKDTSLTVKLLSYNCDSTLLGIHIISSDGTEQIMIYVRSNWKWYCKQVVVIKDKIALFLWKDKHTIMVVGQKGQIQTIEYNFVFHSSMSSCNKGNDINGYTIVVDGPLLNFTPLGKQLMPPPMFEKQVSLASHPVCISMYNSQTVAIDLHNQLYYFNADNIPTDLVPLMILQEPLSFIQNFEYQDTNYLVGVQNHNAYDSIVLINLKQAKVVKQIQLEFKVQRLCLGAALVHSPKFESEEYQTQNSLWLTSGHQGMLMGYQAEPEVCLVIQSTKREIFKLAVDLTTGQSDCELQFLLEFLAINLKTCMLTAKPVIVSLTSNLRLYINDRMLSNECTGFLITQNFILFTNTTSGVMHELHIYDLNRQLPTDHTKLPKPSPQGDFNVRSVERGSRLVCCPSSKLVMQMPRGNLEGIQPRIILCKEIVQLVKDTQYGKAFRLLRQHKVDINLIYDVDPQLFLSNIGKFVAEVKQVDYLNLFVNSLNDSERGRELEFMYPTKDEDLVVKKHLELSQKFNFAAKQEKPNKINTICSALKSELERVDKDNNYLLPILTTYIKRQPQQLKQVLVKIQEMQRSEKELGLTSRVIPPHLNPQTMKRDIDTSTIKIGSKEALEFVSWLVQPNKLFDVALTTFDFELVTLVASQTQKDPKEYVPYLQQLKAFTNFDYMKFKIHFDLKDYEQALEHLAQSQEDSHFDEALQLIRKQRMFKQALQCYKRDSDKLRRVNLAFAEYLEQRGYVEEAGFAYLTANDHKASMQAFLVALNVDMFLSVAAFSGIDKENLQETKQDLVSKLVTAGRFEEAGDLVDPQSEFDLALDCYLKAGNYQKAIKVSMLTNRDLQPIKQSVFFSFELKYNQLKSVLDTYIKRTLRLAIVQNTKRTMPQSSMGTGNFELDSEQLSVSQYSESNKSRSVGFSETSKKSKRQNQAVNKMRKKRQVKEGSPYEEEYLIELIQQETQLQVQDKAQVKDLMKMLLFFGYFDEAAQLHSLVEKIIIAKFEAEMLQSVDAEKVIAEQPQLKEVLGLGRSEKRMEEQKRELQDWENNKSFKH